VETKSAEFEPEKFEDRYENALVELLNQKRKGEPVRTAVKQRDTGNVINLMDAQEPYDRRQSGAFRIENEEV
jgi:DNA end-binding protein Ku